MQLNRVFFAGALVVFIGVLALIGLGAPARMDSADASVEAGYVVWRDHACQSCHTLDGVGGAYAPDLTHIINVRGEVFLREFWVNPQAFHPNQRTMPSLGLTRDETDALVAFLTWIDKQPNGGFPTHPINVSGGGIDVASLLPAESVGAQSIALSDPVSVGHYLFSRPPANCATCHSLEPGVVIVGPSLAGIATRAGTRVEGLSAEAYIHQSILTPGAFVVPGFPDAMARNLGDVLNSDQINSLIAFLLTLD